MSVYDLETQARAAIGPDEPSAVLTAENMNRDYWEFLAALAAEQGVHVTADALSKAPHQVVLAPRLLQLIDTRTQ